MTSCGGQVQGIGLLLYSYPYRDGIKKHPIKQQQFCEVLKKTAKGVISRRSRNQTYPGLPYTFPQDHRMCTNMLKKKTQRSLTAVEISSVGDLPKDMYLQNLFFLTQPSLCNRKYELTRAVVMYEHNDHRNSKQECPSS